ncbi:hypothetical protein Lalb_Chr08g0234381 [Lupinus albus]|uniref:Uncharacterized protein n=1 Tax=Lupinus albus TaxID=3870 RepID=A0A6A4Q2J9_LUPAL|nr:hypothetical protein Lalb_Chr08g0234381 [Lupinus albus]
MHVKKMQHLQKCIISCVKSFLSVRTQPEFNGKPDVIGFEFYPSLIFGFGRAIRPYPEPTPK